MSNPRSERVAGAIRAVIGDIIVRQEIKDPRVRNAGLITITSVKLTGDLRQARIAFMVHGANDKQLAEVEAGLNRAAGFVRHRVGRELTTKVIPTVEFYVDRVFVTEEKVDRILHEIEVEDAGRPKAEDGDEQGDGDGDRHGDAMGPRPGT